MSRRILWEFQNYGKSYHNCLNHTKITCATARNISTNNNLISNINNRTTRLGQTTILVQQGSDIQELPVILRKMKTDEFVTIFSNTNKTVEEYQSNATIGHQEIEIKPDEIIDCLKNCSTTYGILSVINDIPERYLCAEIAAFALDKLIRSETIIGLRNLEDSSIVFNKLLQYISKNGDHRMLLDFMEVLKTFLGLQKTVQRFCDELLLRNSDGILNIIEICECIERFVDCKQYEAAEKFWTGISDNEKAISDQNIKFVYKILPKLRISRRLVIGVIERRIEHVWWNLKSDAVTESLIALTESKSSNGCGSQPPVRTMQYFSRWLNTNIHAISETNLEKIINSLTKLDYSNNGIEKAIERYVKAKGIKVKSINLITEILDHCIHFRLRNHHVLNGCAEYFIYNHEQVQTDKMRSILTIYGQLDYQPLNGIKFWQTVETYLKQHFNKMAPQDLINIFLNCSYLEVYPLNFVSSIFNPYFLDLINSTTPVEEIQNVHNDLKLLDATLTLETKSYKGPLLPRDHSAKSIWQDGRINRVVNSLNVHFEKIIGSIDSFTNNVIIEKLPTNSLYVIDLLIHPPGFKNFVYSIRNDRNAFIAVLVMIPEYYDSKDEFLIGPQQMRIRHLRKLGIRVVTLNYDMLTKLQVYPEQMEKYLVKQIRQALLAYPEE